jgi:heptosyltransferase-2
METERILVRSPNWVGDQIMSYPFFYYLRKAFPSAKITTACVPWVRDIQFMNLVDNVHVLKTPFKKTLLERFKTVEENARDLKALGPWSLAVSLPNSLSSAWMLKRSGAARCRGYKIEGRGFLLNDGVAWDGDPERHRAQAYMDLLPAGVKTGRPAREFWGIPPKDEMEDAVPGVEPFFDSSKAWPGFKPLELPEGPYWILAPGATADSRRWPAQYFASLARLIAKEKNWKGLIVGGPAEAPLADELCSDRTLKLSDWTARGGIPVLSKLFSSAKFTITNESGMAHVASLCGSFVQIVCGAADPRRTRPIGPGRLQIAINPIDCWPCERNVCSLPDAGRPKCLHGISPEAVWEEIKRGIRA